MRVAVRRARDRPLRQLVRPMRVGDIPQVMEIEQQSFPTMWPPTAFKRELESNRLGRYLAAVRRRSEGGGSEPPGGEPTAGGLGQLLGGLRQVLAGDRPLPPEEEREELVLGFVGVWLLADEAHIVTIAVRESQRGRGIGELLLIAAVETALAEGRSVVTLECRVSNEVALRLYEKYGFRRVGLRRRYYSDNREDAVILTAGGVDAPAYRQLLQELREEHKRRFGEYDLEM